MSRVARKVLKIVLWVIGSVLALVILLAISLNIPAVQNFVKDRVISYLKTKTKTEISLERIRISFPTGLELDKFYVQDLKNDTLLYAGKLAVQLDMIGLIKSKIEVNQIELSKVYANVYRNNPDTSFNYQFLVDAFVSADQEPETPSDSSAPLQLQLGKINLNDIRLKFKDDVAGNDAGVSLERLNARVSRFDLENMHYVLDQLELANTQLHYFQKKPLTNVPQTVDTTVVETASETPMPIIEVKNFAFSDIDLKYDDQLSDTKAIVFLKTFNFNDLLVDLAHGTYSTSGGELSNSNIEFAYRSAPASSSDSSSADTTSSPFSLYLDKIILSNNRIKYDDLAAPRQKGMLDYNHLDIKNLGLSADDIAMDSSGIKATVNSGNLMDTSGFVLNNLKGKIIYDDEQISVEDFVLKTPHTYIDNNSLITYTTLDDLTKHPEKVNMEIQFRKSVLGLADATYFVSSIPAAYRNQKINLAALVKGKLSDIDIDQLQISGLKNTQIDINGSIKGLPEMDRTVFNIAIAKFNTSRSDLNAILPKGTLPTDIELPNYIAANGKFNGGISKFSTHLDVRTDMGSAKLTGAMGGSSKNPTYKARVDLRQFNVGRLLKQPDIGTISLFLDVAGSGTSAQTAHATVNGAIYSAYYNKYNYKNIKLKGTYAKQALQLQTSSTDSNAHFDIATHLNMAGKYPSINGTIDLKRIDLEKLHFADSELKLAGLAVLDFPTASPDYLNGNAQITSLQIATDGKLINMDTISMVAAATDTTNNLQLKSDILDVTLDGKYQLTQIGQAFINEIDRYYAFAPMEKIAPQKMMFNVAIHDSKLLKELVPSIHTLAPSYLNGLIDTEMDSLIVNAGFPHVVYDSYDLKGITLNINNRDSSQLAYALNMKSLESSSIQLYNVAVTGAAANNTLDVNLFLRDKNNKDKYVVGGIFKVADENYQFSLDPQKLLLNYDKWQVNPNNLLQYGNAGVYVRDFEISNSGQSLAVNSTANTTNAPINVQFKNFMLETLTRYAEQDTALVVGTLNGTVDIKNIATTPQFEANLSVNKLRYKADELGDLKLLSDNYTTDAYKVDVALSGIHNLRVNGFYYTSGDGSIDMNIDVDKIDLSHIESLSEGQLRNGSGMLSGKLTAKGAVTDPKILGNLHFNKAAFNIAALNSYFKFNDETVYFIDNAIQFKNFTMRDSANQAMTLNGTIKTADYSNPGFNLKLRANNFRLLNSTSVDNELFYGKVYVTVNGNITGDMNKPEVTGSLTINKDTRFFFAIPDDDPGVVDQDGIVEFIDMDAPPNNGRQAINVDSLTRSPLKGVHLSMDLKTEKEAEVTVVVDPANGDALLVKGEAELNVTMDPSGKISMTGRYLVSDGSYNLSIGGLAKRKFTLQQGSYIQWTGAPTEANIDLTALYNVTTAPIDLVADQIQEMDASTQMTFRQKLPFTVYLKMTDQLLKPKIAFEVSMPENEKNAFDGIVYTRLQQINSNESELNKQVFALLALNRFISDNPFQSLSGGTSPEMLARQSVSRLLTQQLNNLASDLIKGVDLSFDLTSQDDYSTGSQQTRTDLNVALSKSLLNDRLTITVGSDFTLEGRNQNSGSNSNIAGNVNVEYLLSRDGRYRLRAYRRNQSDVVIQGQIIETGLGFALVVDYNQFREIFNSLKKRQRRGERR